MIALARIAPELRKATSRMSMLPLPIGSAWGRRLTRGLLGRRRAVEHDGVTIETPANTPVPLRLYHPARRANRAALLWVHGGGYVIGAAAQDDGLCTAVARELGIMVVSVEYRLAPEHPFPAPLDDCRAAWTWMEAEAVVLGIDPLKIAIGGQSAGAGLAAALVQRIHAEGAAQPAAQWLFCPMIDDRTAAKTDLDRIGHRIWSNRVNRDGWRCYLGREPGATDVPPFAAPARTEDLAGLPPAWIGVGDVDLFCEEDRAYAARLQAAGIDVTLDIVPGAPHGFEAWAADTAIAQAYLARARAWLQARFASGEG